MTLAKDTLNTLLWLPINSIPLGLQEAHRYLREQKGQQLLYCLHSCQRFNWCPCAVLAHCRVVHLP